MIFLRFVINRYKVGQIGVLCKLSGLFVCLILHYVTNLYIYCNNCFKESQQAWRLDPL